MSDASGPVSGYGHEVLAAVLQVRRGATHVLLWQRAQDPARGAWVLPGGELGADEHLDASIRRQLAEKVDVHELTHLEQLDSRGQPGRVPGRRTVATSYLGLVPVDADPRLPADTAWHPVADLPTTAFDHGDIVAAAVGRLSRKLSYTNLGFALAPAQFTMSELARIYRAALGHDVDVTNLQRVLVRRGQIEPTGEQARPGRGGGRPAAIYRFTARELAITDPFAVLAPPRGECTPPGVPVGQLTAASSDRPAHRTDTTANDR